MLTTNGQIDANFYNMIHQLADSVQLDRQEDRRKEPREAYPSTQRIATRRGSDLPDESQFFDVRFYDLTRSGFSFLVPSAPASDSLVAAIGASPNTIYLAAEVTHRTEVLVYSSGLVERAKHSAAIGRHGLNSKDATPMVLVGCRFTEKIENR